MFSIFRDNRDDLQDLSGFPVVERTSFQLYHWLNYDSTSFINLAQLIPLQVTRLGRTMRPRWGLLEKNVNDINVALTLLKERMMQQIFVCVRAKYQSGRSPTRFLWHKLESFFSTQDGMQGHPGSSLSPVFNPSVPVYQYWIWLQWRIVRFGKVFCPWLHNSSLDLDSKALTTRTKCISQCKIKWAKERKT